MGDLVDSSHSAFIKGRSIVDNIYLAQELLRKYARKRISPRCMLKIDIQKVYDTVDWDFLREAMQLLKFLETFVAWILECVTTTSYSISMNGKFHGFMVGKRGLRQGDPLSPFLFTICLEVLSRMLKKMFRSPRFGYHPKCINLNITHLAYADDLLLMSRGEISSVQLLFNCLNRFGDMAGLRINLLKSNIYLAGVEQGVRQDILDYTDFVQGNLPFRYLGFTLASWKLRTSDYTLLLDAITRKIQAWPRNSLSYAENLFGLQSTLRLHGRCYVEQKKMVEWDLRIWQPGIKLF